MSKMVSQSRPALYLMIVLPRGKMEPSHPRLKDSGMRPGVA